MARNHYLSNKELLKEIHNSKMSYCYVMDDKYYYFDLILDGDQDITPEHITEAKQNRAARLQKQAHEEQVLRWERGELERKTKPRGVDFAVDPDTISDDDIVIRKSRFICPRTLAIGSDTSSDLIPREIIKKLQNPKTKGIFEISVD